MFKIKSVKHNEVLNKVLDVLRSAHEVTSIADVILYGSCARGEENDNSDIDLFIVLKDMGLNNNELDNISHNLRFAVTKSIGWIGPHADLHFTVGDYWRKDNSLYHLLILDDGISVWK